jgi:hypothetical protein
VRPTVRTFSFGKGERSGVAVDVEVDLDENAIDRLLAGRGGDVNKMLQGFASIATKEVRAEADRKVTTRTGRYKRSIGSKVEPPTRLRVTADAPYAAILEKGSRRHPITPKRARALRFEVSEGATTKVVFAQRVDHPGTKPYNILRDGTRKAGLQLNRLARRG